MRGMKNLPLRKIIVALALLLVLSSLAFSQQPTFHDPLLDEFQGNWVLRGTVMGKETTHDITNDWVLNHQYLRIHEVSREKNAKGEPEYEAMVFIGWDNPTSRYVCIWLDVWGGFLTVAYAPRSGDEMRFLFNDGKSDFHTTFLYDRKANVWEWRMDSEENGKLKPFLRAKLTKSPAP
jgi:hypothetical protein